jgi:NodT family efflux transporter outer membrane factor (OMF) lipoprotein
MAEASLMNDQSEISRSWARWLTLGSVVCLLGSGCCLTDWAHNDFRVGPNYCRPPAPVAENWIDYRDPRVRSQEVDLSEWWRVFKDPVLDSLIEDAYQQNLSLRVAGARILQARAVRGIAIGTLFPQSQDAFGDERHIKLSQKAANPPTDAWFEDWTTGFRATWELDLWGKFRRAVEAADAELDASIENYDDVLVVLLADVATNYVQYRTFEQRLFYAHLNVEIQTKAFQLAKDKFEAGASTERDMQQARQVLEQTRALIPQLEIGRRQAANRLCVLLGIPPIELANRLGSAGIPRVSYEVAVGIPADLIRRRPDIRRAERQAAAQSARIGVAEADLYPHFSLVGTIGLEAEHFKDLWHTPESLIGEFGPSFRWDILNYGRIENNVALQDARFQELAFAYQDTVLRAGREVEDALVAFLRFQEQAARLADSVRAAERTVEITAEQYRQGAVDFTPVFLFESTLAEQQDVLAVAQGDIVLSLIQIYRALGGGWEMRLLREGNGCGNGGCVGSGVQGVQSVGMPAEAQVAVPAATNKMATSRPAGTTAKPAPSRRYTGGSE